MSMPIHEVREHMRDGLRSVGLWCPDRRFHSTVREQRSRGDVLYRQLVESACSTTDLSGTMLSLDAFRARLANTLCFGYEIGLGLHAVRQDRIDMPCRAAVACALFNAGVSLFDFVCDRMPDSAATELLDVVNERTLLRLLGDREFHAKVARASGLVRTVEVRVLLLLISTFFSNLHESMSVGHDSTEWTLLSEMLVTAYKAQVYCAGLVSSDRLSPVLLIASREKSTLPFKIMLQIDRVCSPKAIGSHEAEATELINNLASAFWIIDDIADIESDLVSRAVNSVVCECTVQDQRQGSQPHLDSMRIGELIASVCAGLSAAVRVLEAPQFGHRQTVRFKEIILASLRSWLGGSANSKLAYSQT